MKLAIKLLKSIVLLMIGDSRTHVNTDDQAVVVHTAPGGTLSPGVPER